MAINLVARMSLVDKFTNPMRKMERQMNSAGKATSRMQRKMLDTTSAMDKMNRSGSHVSRTVGGFSTMFNKGITSAGRFASALNPLNSGLIGIAAAAGAAYGAVKVFNATVGEAMKMQQSEIIIGAMFDNKKLSKDYMKMMDNMAINSPLLDSQAMYGNSKTFVALSKDNKQLEKMWKLTEKLMASTPEQGVEGSVYALRQLFSGDSVSIVDRFNLDKNVMNQIKKLPLEQQMSRMDDYMNKMGFTTKLIEDMGGTALGMWTQVKERFQLVLRDMGEPSLKAVSKFLGGLLTRLEGQDMKKFGKWGGRVIQSMVTGLSSSAIGLYDWFTGLANDPEFKRLTTISGKVNFIVADIGDHLTSWLENGGRDKLTSFGETVTGIMVGALNQSKPFIDLGAKLGHALWKGLQSGIEESAKETSLGKLLTGPFITSTNLKNYNAMQTSTQKTEGEMNRNYTSFGKPKDKSQTGIQFLKEKFSGSKSHSAGIDRIPYSGYAASLHKDEKVLNAQEAREYREGGKGGNTYNFNVSMDGNGDMEKQARKLMDIMARLIEQEGGQMGRA